MFRRSKQSVPATVRRFFFSSIAQDIFFQQCICPTLCGFIPTCTSKFSYGIKTAESLKVITKTIPHPGNDGKVNFRC